MFFDIIDLLREPKRLAPLEEACVLPLEERNAVLDQLLVIRRRWVRNAGRDLSASVPPCAR